MFEDWVKIGDVIVWGSSELIRSEVTAILIVLALDHVHMATMTIDNYTGECNSTIDVERPSHFQWNKRSHWIACGWKFL